MASEIIDPPIFISFRELQDGLDVLGRWVQFFKTGTMLDGGKKNKRFTQCALHFKTKDALHTVAITALDQHLTIGGYDNALYMEYREELRDRAGHLQILNVIKKNIKYLDKNYFRFFFEVIPDDRTLPSQILEYYFVLIGNLTDVGINVTKIECRGFDLEHLLENIKHISKITTMLKQTNIKDNGEMKSVNIHDANLALKVVKFFEKKQPYRQCILGNTPTEIVTNAYNHEIAAAISFIQLIEVPDL